MSNLVILASFNGPGNSVDGPVASLTLDAAGDLFGTTVGGGSQNEGTVFEILFSDGSYASTPTILFNDFNMSTGASPAGGLLIDSAGDLIGTTQTIIFELPYHGGSYASGLAILSPDCGFVGNLITDANGDIFGAAPQGTSGGGGYGSVFEIPYTGGSYGRPNILVSFNPYNGSGDADPEGGVIMDAAGDLFGTTSGGGLTDGTVFELVNNGSGSYTLRNLINFNGADGNSPLGGLVADAAGDLFGTTWAGGAYGQGTVFEVTKTAGGYASMPTTLFNFTGPSTVYGAYPDAGLIIDAVGDLFGTTFEGGLFGDGTAFELKNNFNGSYAEGILANFGGANGAYPEAGLIADSAGDLFGTTASGGGTVFEITDSGYQVSAPAPPVVTLASSPAASNVATATLGTAVPANGTDALSVALMSDPDFATGSTLTLSNGTLIYTPGLITAGLVGTDTISYAVTDTVTGGVTTETQAVTLSNGPAPLVTLAASPSASNGTTATLGTAAPANGTDALSVALTSDADFATGSTLTLSNGTLIYTPGLITAGLVGTDTISYAVTDTVTGGVTTETQAVTLSNGPAPLVTLAASPSASNGTTATLGTAAPANGTDALTVALTFDADFATGSTITLSNGALIYTPGLVIADLAGTDTISYAVTDTVTGGVTTETQTVTLSNGPAPLVTLAASPSASNGTTAASRSYRRVEPLELHAGIGGGELPVGFGVMTIAVRLPGGDLLGQRGLVGDAAIEALRGQHAEF